MSLIAIEGRAPALSFLLSGFAVFLIGRILVQPWSDLAIVCGIFHFSIAAFIVAFFRDPDRKTPLDPSTIIAPADGRLLCFNYIEAIGRRPTSLELEEEEFELDPISGPWSPLVEKDPLCFKNEQRWRNHDPEIPVPNSVIHIVTHMSPLDVHVNRAPISGRIRILEHRTGSGRKRGPFRIAKHKEAEYNERVRIVIEGDNGFFVEVTQIAGALARSISPAVHIGEHVKRGQRIGMIRLGSRVDVRIPADACKINQNNLIPNESLLLAGSSILGWVVNRDESE